ncbi:MAG TPA: cation:proton antiporter, partial [Acetobacteraceae bacterium]|nr:cation:proton antiporter [Acetobacteraceae bacterium]
SPPDAVSAGAVLDRLRIPRRLVAVLEGESLVNDASGLVLYRFGVAVMMGGSFHAASAGITFVLVAAGGIGIGIGCGWAVVQAIRLLRVVNLQIAATFLAAWGSYIAADAIGASGVLSTVACGLVLGWEQHAALSPETRQDAEATWAFVTFTLESLVFVLIGLSLRGILLRLDRSGLVAALGVATVITVVTMAARFAWVFPAIYLPFWFVRFALRGRFAVPMSIKPGIPLAISWAGMRGVVSLAAALALPDQFPGRDLLVLVTFAVILGTVLIQATTLGPFIRWLGIARDPEHERSEEEAARRAIADAELRHIREQAKDELIGPVAQELVDEYSSRAEVRDDGPLRGAKRARVQTHLSLRLQALDAARTEILRRHRAGELHDTVLRRLERELDLQDLRYRTTLRAIG